MATLRRFGQDPVDTEAPKTTSRLTGATRGAIAGAAGGAMESALTGAATGALAGIEGGPYGMAVGAMTGALKSGMTGGLAKGVLLGAGAGGAAGAISPESTSTKQGLIGAAVTGGLASTAQKTLGAVGKGAYSAVRANGLKAGGSVLKTNLMGLPSQGKRIAGAAIGGTLAGAGAAVVTNSMINKNDRTKTNKVRAGLGATIGLGGLAAGTYASEYAKRMVQV